MSTEKRWRELRVLATFSAGDFRIATIAEPSAEPVLPRAFDSKAGRYHREASDRAESTSSRSLSSLRRLIDQAPR